MEVVVRVSIRDLKDHLSGYLKKVQSGEEMIVTFHEKPLAKIIPFSQPDSARMTRAEWLKKIRKLHQSLGKLKLKEPMSETIVKRRQEERY